MKTLACLLCLAAPVAAVAAESAVSAKIESVGLFKNGLATVQAVVAVPGTGDPNGSLPDKVFGPEQALAFLGGIDYLALAMPLNPANTGRIGERELRAMKPTAYLLNPARGPLVNEAALLRALSEGWIAGA